VSAVQRSSVAFNSLDRDQFDQRNVQQKFWTGNLCQLCQGPLYGGIEHSLAVAVGISARSVTLARASIRMRRLFRQQPCVWLCNPAH